MMDAFHLLVPVSEFWYCAHWINEIVILVLLVTPVPSLLWHAITSTWGSCFFLTDRIQCRTWTQMWFCWFTWALLWRSLWQPDCGPAAWAQGASQHPSAGSLGWSGSAAPPGKCWHRQTLAHLHWDSVTLGERTGNFKSGAVCSQKRSQLGSGCFWSTSDRGPRTPHYLRPF